MKITEELLIAYADGEVDAETRAAVEAAMMRDATVRDRVEAHRRLRGTAAGAFGGTARGERRPPSRPAEIVDLAAVRARKAPPKAKPASNHAWIQWTALAACVVAGVVLARGLGGMGVGPMVGDRHGTLMAQGSLAHALDDQLAGHPGSGAPARIGVSFRATDRSFCRTFQTLQGAGLAGLACRGPDGWQVRVAAASPPVSTNASGYRTTASPMPAAVIATVDATIDGAPLDAQAEAAAKAKGWRD
jgi:hypothetical protein